MKCSSITSLSCWFHTFQFVLMALQNFTTALSVRCCLEPR